jgi:hypothetical protein
MPIETANKFLVGLIGDRIVIGKPPSAQTGISPDDALLLAAMLVELAEYRATHKFEEVLAAVQNS